MAAAAVHDRGRRTLTEEIVFRGVLQGWLRRATLIGHIALLLVMLVAGALPLLHYVALQLADEHDREILRGIAPADWGGAIASPILFGSLAAGYAGCLWWMGRRQLRTFTEVWLWRPGADLLLAQTPGRERRARDGRGRQGGRR